MLNLLIVVAGLAAGMAFRLRFGSVRTLVPPEHRDRVSGIMIRYLSYGWLLGALFFLPMSLVAKGVIEGHDLSGIAAQTLVMFVVVPTAGIMFFVSIAALGLPAAAVAGVLHATAIVRRGSLGWIGAIAIGTVSSGAGWLMIGGGIVGSNALVGANDLLLAGAWFASGIIATLLLRWGDNRRARRRSV